MVIEGGVQLGAVLGEPGFGQADRPGGAQIGERLLMGEIVRDQLQPFLPPDVAVEPARQPAEGIDGRRFHSRDRLVIGMVENGGAVARQQGRQGRAHLGVEVARTQASAHDQEERLAVGGQPQEGFALRSLAAEQLGADGGAGEDRLVLGQMRQRLGEARADGLGEGDGEAVGQARGEIGFVDDDGDAGAPDSKAAPVPAGEIAPDTKPTPAPPIEKLPGSFEDGGEDTDNLPAD